MTKLCLLRLGFPRSVLLSVLFADFLTLSHLTSIFSLLQSPETNSLTQGFLPKLRYSVLRTPYSVL